MRDQAHGAPVREGARPPRRGSPGIGSCPTRRRAGTSTSRRTSGSSSTSSPPKSLLSAGSARAGGPSSSSTTRPTATSRTCPGRSPTRASWRGSSRVSAQRSRPMPWSPRSAASRCRKPRRRPAVCAMAVCDDAPTFERITAEARALAPSSARSPISSSTIAGRGPRLRRVHPRAARADGSRGARERARARSGVHGQGVRRARGDGRARQAVRSAVLHTGGLPGLLAQGGTFAEEV